MTSSSEAAKRTSNKRGILWEDNEVNALIAVWGEEYIQAKLDGTTHNIKVFKATAQKLSDLGFKGRTAMQCREKNKKLKGNYRRDWSRPYINKSGQNHRTYKYLEQMNSILGTLHMIWRQGQKESRQTFQQVV